MATIDDKTNKADDEQDPTVKDAMALEALGIKNSLHPSNDEAKKGLDWERIGSYAFSGLTIVATLYVVSLAWYSQQRDKTPEIVKNFARVPFKISSDIARDRKINYAIHILNKDGCYTMAEQRNIRRFLTDVNSKKLPGELTDFYKDSHNNLVISGEYSLNREAKKGTYRMVYDPSEGTMISNINP